VVRPDPGIRGTHLHVVIRFNPNRAAPKSGPTGLRSRNGHLSFSFLAMLTESIPWGANHHSDRERFDVDVEHDTMTGLAGITNSVRHHSEGGRFTKLDVASVSYCVVHIAGVRYEGHTGWQHRLRYERGRTGPDPPTRSNPTRPPATGQPDRQLNARSHISYDAGTDSGEPRHTAGTGYPPTERSNLTAHQLERFGTLRARSTHIAWSVAGAYGSTNRDPE